MPKIVYGSWYVHRDNKQDLPTHLAAMLERAVALHQPSHEWNIARVDPRQQQVTLSWYPTFYEEPHPSLTAWTTIHLASGQHRMCQSHSDNPMILHRKENFIAASDRRYAAFSRLTSQEEHAGLFDRTTLTRIGRKQFWERLLTSKGLVLTGHQLGRAT